MPRTAVLIRFLFSNRNAARGLIDSLQWTSVPGAMMHSHPAHTLIVKEQGRPTGWLTALVTAASAWVYGWYHTEACAELPLLSWD